MIIGVLPKNVNIPIGSLGNCTFLSGWYFYCGNARGPGGLLSRISRHLKKEKKLFWHYDYLRPYLAIMTIFLFSGYMDECMLNQLIKSFRSVIHPVASFGASDCVVGCGSHLLFTAELSATVPVINALNQSSSYVIEWDWEVNLLKSS